MYDRAAHVKEFPRDLVIFIKLIGAEYENKLTN